MNTDSTNAYLPQLFSAGALEEIVRQSALAAERYREIAVRTASPNPHTFDELGYEEIAKANEKRAADYREIASATPAPSFRREKPARLLQRQIKMAVRAANYKYALERDRETRAAQSRLKAKPIVLKGCSAKPRTARARRSAAARVRPASASSSAPSGSDGPPRRTHRRHEIASTASPLSHSRRAG